MFWLLGGSIAFSQCHSHPGVGGKAAALLMRHSTGEFVFFPFMHTDPAQNGKPTVHCERPCTHMHMGILFHCNFVNSIRFESIIFFKSKS